MQLKNVLTARDVCNHITVIPMSFYYGKCPILLPDVLTQKKLTEENITLAELLWKL